MVEFCSALPTKYKVNTDQTKIILRNTFGKLLTDSILNKKKQGFGAPVEKWLKTPAMEKLSDNDFKKPKLESFFKTRFSTGSEALKLYL